MGGGGPTNEGRIGGLDELPQLQRRADELLLGPAEIRRCPHEEARVKNLLLLRRLFLLLLLLRLFLVLGYVHQGGNVDGLLGSRLGSELECVD